MAGKAPSADAFAAAGEAASAAIDPMEDLQANAKFRRDLVRTVTRRALGTARPHECPHHDIKTWVGRSIRRVEDPALITGRGRFTGDLAAQRWVSFVRSPVAYGRIKKITPPPGAMVMTAADLEWRQADQADVAQVQLYPDLPSHSRRWCGRFMGEPVAIVIADSEEEAEDIAEQVELEIEETPPLVDARAAIGEARLRSTAKRRPMSSSRGG